MSATLTQMGPFLMSDALFNGHLGAVRHACRLNVEGAEFLSVQCIDTTLTAHDAFVYRLSKAVEIAVKHPRDGLAQPRELGIVGRQYFVAGEYPDGPTLNRIVARCETLTSGISVSESLGVTIKALEILANLQRQEGPIWYGHLDLDNLYLNSDGSLSLGWDGLQTSEGNSDREWRSALLALTEQLVQMLGRLAVASDDTDMPDNLSDWLRVALSPGGRPNSPDEILKSLKSLGIEFSQSLDALLELFSREYAVVGARTRRLREEVESMPEGARRRIARTAAQILVNYGRERQLTPVQSYRSSSRSGVLYEGEMGPLDCPRLLYRYAAAGVSGRLELDGPRGHNAVHFRRGRIVGLASTLPDLSLKEWVMNENLIDERTLMQAVGKEEKDPDLILRAIVEQGICGHHQVLRSFETYSETVVEALVGESLSQYHFFSDTKEHSFGFGPGKPISAIVAHALMKLVDQDTIDHFLGPFADAQISRMDNELVRVEDLRLSTRQLRAWNAIQEDLALQDVRMRLTGIPGVTHGFAGRIITLLERLDFGRFER